jgi:outer membrane protein TolC
MRPHYNIWLITGVLIAFSSSLFAAPFSLDSFLKMSQKQNLSFKKILLEQHSITPDSILASDIDDLTLSLSLGHYLQESSATENVSLYSLSFSQLFPLTGATAAGSYAETLSDQINKKQTSFSLSLTQPILRNGFGYQLHLANKNRHLTEKITYLSILESYEDYLAFLINSYFDWHLAYVEWTAAKDLVADYNKLLRDMESRKRNHIATNLDLNKMRVQLLSKKEALLKAELQLFNTKETLSGIIRETMPSTWKPTLPPSLEKPDFNKTEVYLNESRTATLIRLSESILDNQSLINKNMLAPDVDVALSFSSTSTSGGEATDKLLAHIAIPLPFASKHEKASVEKTKIETNIAKANNQLSQEKWEQHLTVIKKSYKKEATLLSIYKRKVRYLKRIVRDERKEFRTGRSTLNQLIQALNNLESANTQRLIHAHQVERLNVEWKQLTDTLVQQIPK